MTAQELLDYSHEPYRTELIAGTLVEMEPAGALHGAVAAGSAGCSASMFGLGGLERCSAPRRGFTWSPSPTRSARPTRASSRASGSRAIGGIPSEFFPGPPDVAFEVTSPRDRRGEVQSKTSSWLEAGTAAVIVVDPRRRVATVHRPDRAPQTCSGSDALDLDDILPGFAPTVDVLLT